MMTLKTTILALAAAVMLGAAVEPTARTEGGAAAGTRANGVDAWRGLPYARAPVGELRWREPQRPDGWNGVRDATLFAPACLQTGTSMPGEPSSPVSEDCLYLNVWAPADATPGSLPVIVWIPGGGLSNGSTSIPLYDGEHLAGRGVVVVTVAYRLGALGFLAHPELTAESGQGGSGNYGLLDQIAALEWVRRNIAGFGGDPESVTIAGQSAGATSVSILMASPRARGLFQRAIGQSGGMFEPVELAPNYLLANAERDGLAYAGSLGAPSLAQLRALPADRFLGRGAGAVTHPVVEPRVLPLPPYDAFTTGRYNDVPLLVGFNADEASSLTEVGDVTAETFASGIERRWGSLPPALLAPYAFTSDDEARRARLDFERDLRFGWNIWTWARLQASHGQAPVHAYYFTRRPAWQADSVRKAWGAAHFAELWYMFDHLEPDIAAWTAADRALAAAMTAYWVEFARDGDPNHAGAPHWPVFTSGDQQVLHLGEDMEAGVLPNRDALASFDAVYSSIRRPAPAP